MLLGLSIVDPACGSGHFLLAAARRLAAHVARLQANGTPSAAEYRHALRQVVGRCIFGVDVNPMAVELCKVGLWMEAVEPGLPLTFLIGATLAAVTGRRVALLSAVRSGIGEILPVVGILVGVGMLIEMLTLTGLRGAIVVGSLPIPSVFLFASIAVILPLFGGISVYCGASVLGVPFALALLGRNQIVVLSALSLIGAMGSYIPPVAFTPVVTSGLRSMPQKVPGMSLCFYEFSRDQSVQLPEVDPKALIIRPAPDSPC